MAQELDGDLYFSGTVSFGKIVVPAQSFGNAEIIANPAAPITTNKVQHRYLELLRIPPSGKSTDDVVTGRYVLFPIRSITGATLVEVRAGHVTIPTGTGKFTVDVLRNGVSVLSAPFDVAAAVPARGTVAAALIATPASVQNDLFEVDVVANAGTGVVAKGAFVELIFDMNP